MFPAIGVSVPVRGMPGAAGDVSSRRWGRQTRRRRRYPRHEAAWPVATACRPMTIISILPPFRDGPSDTASWIINVARTPWDLVNMSMTHGLTRDFSTTHSDIKPAMVRSLPLMRTQTASIRMPMARRSHPRRPCGLLTVLMIQTGDARSRRCQRPAIGGCWIRGQIVSRQPETVARIVSALQTLQKSCHRETHVTRKPASIRTWRTWYQRLMDWSP